MVHVRDELQGGPHGQRYPRTDSRRRPRGKEGSTIKGMMNAFATAISRIAARHLPDRNLHRFG
ncbi:MAG: hypothetical protein ACJ74L_11510 [Gaiellaceae bacterium]